MNAFELHEEASESFAVEDEWSDAELAPYSSNVFDESDHSLNLEDVVLGDSSTDAGSDTPPNVHPFFRTKLQQIQQLGVGVGRQINYDDNDSDPTSSVTSMSNSCNSSGRLCAPILPTSKSAQYLMVKRALMLASSRTVATNAALGAKGIAASALVVKSKTSSLAFIGLGALLLSASIPLCSLASMRGTKPITLSVSSREDVDNAIARAINAIPFDEVGLALLGAHDNWEEVRQDRYAPSLDSAPRQSPSESPLSTFTSLYPQLQGDRDTVLSLTYNFSAPPNLFPSLTPSSTSKNRITSSSSLPSGTPILASSEPTQDNKARPWSPSGVNFAGPSFLPSVKITAITNDGTQPNPTALSSLPRDVHRSLAPSNGPQNIITRAPSIHGGTTGLLSNGALLNISVRPSSPPTAHNTAIVESFQPSENPSLTPLGIPQNSITKAPSLLDNPQDTATVPTVSARPSSLPTHHPFRSPQDASSPLWSLTPSIVARNSRATPSTFPSVYPSILSYGETQDINKTPILLATTGHDVAPSQRPQDASYGETQDINKTPILLATTGHDVAPSQRPQDASMPPPSQPTVHYPISTPSAVPQDSAAKASSMSSVPSSALPYKQTIFERPSSSPTSKSIEPLDDPRDVVTIPTPHTPSTITHSKSFPSDQPTFLRYRDQHTLSMAPSLGQIGNPDPAPSGKPPTTAIPQSYVPIVYHPASIPQDNTAIPSALPGVFPSFLPYVFDREILSSFPTLAPSSIPQESNTELSSLPSLQSSPLPPCIPQTTPTYHHSFEQSDRPHDSSMLPPCQRTFQNPSPAPSSIRHDSTTKPSSLSSVQSISPSPPSILTSRQSLEPVERPPHAAMIPSSRPDIHMSLAPSSMAQSSRTSPSSLPSGHPRFRPHGDLIDNFITHPALLPNPGPSPEPWADATLPPLPQSIHHRSLAPLTTPQNNMSSLPSLRSIKSSSLPHGIPHELPTKSSSLPTAHHGLEPFDGPQGTTTIPTFNPATDPSVSTPSRLTVPSSVPTVHPRFHPHSGLGSITESPTPVPTAHGSVEPENMPMPSTFELTAYYSQTIVPSTISQDSTTKPSAFLSFPSSSQPSGVMQTISAPSSPPIPYESREPLENPQDTATVPSEQSVKPSSIIHSSTTNPSSHPSVRSGLLAYDAPQNNPITLSSPQITYVDLEPSGRPQDRPTVPTSLPTDDFQSSIIHGIVATPSPLPSVQPSSLLYSVPPTTSATLFYPTLETFDNPGVIPSSITTNPSSHRSVHPSILAGDAPQNNPIALSSPQITYLNHEPSGGPQDRSTVPTSLPTVDFQSSTVHGIVAHPAPHPSVQSSSLPYSVPQTISAKSVYPTLETFDNPGVIPSSIATNPSSHPSVHPSILAGDAPQNNPITLSSPQITYLNLEPSGRPQDRSTVPTSLPTVDFQSSTIQGIVADPSPHLSVQPSPLLYSVAQTTSATTLYPGLETFHNLGVGLSSITTNPSSIKHDSGIISSSPPSIHTSTLPYGGQQDIDKSIPSFRPTHQKAKLPSGPQKIATLPSVSAVNHPSSIPQDSVATVSSHPSSKSSSLPHNMEQAPPWRPSSTPTYHQRLWPLDVLQDASTIVSPNPNNFLSQAPSITSPVSLPSVHPSIVPSENTQIIDETPTYLPRVQPNVEPSGRPLKTSTLPSFLPTLSYSSPASSSTLQDAISSSLPTVWSNPLPDGQTTSARQSLTPTSIQSLESLDNPGDEALIQKFDLNIDLGRTPPSITPNNISIPSTLVPPIVLPYDGPQNISKTPTSLPSSHAILEPSDRPHDTSPGPVPYPTQAPSIIPQDVQPNSSLLPSVHSSSQPFSIPQSIFARLSTVPTSQPSLALADKPHGTVLLPSFYPSRCPSPTPSTTSRTSIKSPSPSIRVQPIFVPQGDPQPTSTTPSSCPTENPSLESADANNISTALIANPILLTQTEENPTTLTMHASQSPSMNEDISMSGFPTQQPSDEGIGDVRHPPSSGPMMVTPLTAGPGAPTLLTNDSHHPTLSAPEQHWSIDSAQPNIMQGHILCSTCSPSLHPSDYAIISDPNSLASSLDSSATSVPLDLLNEPSTLVVKGFSLWDTERHIRVQDLVDGSLICPPSPMRFNIEVVVSIGWKDPILIEYSGPKLKTSRVELVAPYFAFGDVPDEEIYGRWLREGLVRVSAKSLNNTGEPRMIEFQVDKKGCLQ